MTCDWLNMRTIKKQATGCTWPFFIKMSTKRERRTAEKKRESRFKHTELHKRATFISHYLQIKYESIYEEANNFYSELANQYPIKRKLTTAPEYQVWEKEMKRAKASTTDMTSSSTTELCDTLTTTTDIASSSTTELCDTSTTNAERCNVLTTTTGDASISVDPCLNIQLMNKDEVQETRDTIIFQDTFPSITEEINPELIEQIVQEIHESLSEFFDMDDMNSMIQDEINADLINLDPLEQELLYR